MAFRAQQTCIVGLLAVVACGGDEDGDSSPTMADAGTLDPSSTGNPTTGATGTDETMDPTAVDSSSGSVDPTNATSTTGTTDDGVCVPPMASFIIEPPALAQASITFDLAAMSCAAVELTGEAPQIVLDVQPTGTLNATGFGIEITDSSHGLLFEDPPIGDSQVQDLMPDIEFTFLATAVDGTTPMTIVFTIFSQGPVLIDVSVVYG